MPQLDFSTFPSQLFWLFVSFTLLYYFLASHILPKIHDVLDKRQVKITSDLEDAARLKEEAEAAREIYEQALRNARRDAHQLISEASLEAERMVVERQKAFEAKLKHELQTSETRITNARRAARKEIEQMATDLSREIFNKLTGKSIEANKVKQQVEKAVDTLAG